MGVAAHLGIRIAEYDRRIRTFIPYYEEILDATAAAVADTVRSRPAITDLGTGTGALASRVLAAVPRAGLTGIDSDAAMLDVAHRRLRGRLTAVSGDFLSVALPSSDAITASFALHHVRTGRRKAMFYARCFRALRPGGVLVNADCALSSSRVLQSRDREAWLEHLERSYSHRRAEGFLRAWSHEDVYFTLQAELEMMRAAGFSPDVVWRRESFAVVLGTIGR
jgi:ubiquinone/menaquinone biosynthesis C-methylase UbiE